MLLLWPVNRLTSREQLTSATANIHGTTDGHLPPDMPTSHSTHVEPFSPSNELCSLFSHRLSASNTFLQSENSLTFVVKNEVQTTDTAFEINNRSGCVESAELSRSAERI